MKEDPLFRNGGARGAPRWPRRRLVAYLTYSRAAALPEGLPPEVRYVPLDAEVIAYADVKAVFSSELHRQLKPSIESGSRRGRRMMNEFAGVDLEKQVNYVLAYIEPPAAGEPPASDPRVPRALMFVQGSFEQSGIEQFIRDHGGQLESQGDARSSCTVKMGKKLLSVSHVPTCWRSDRPTSSAGPWIALTPPAPLRT